jgi:hypothetical protein
LELAPSPQKKKKTVSKTGPLVCIFVVGGSKNNTCRRAESLGNAEHPVVSLAKREGYRDVDVAQK